MMRRVFAEAARLQERGEPFVMATVVETKGSTPQKTGARLLVRTDGVIVGTLGGGCVEAEVWQEAMTALRSGDGPMLREFSLSDDLAAESGMVCGGTMAIFIEAMTKPVTESPLVGAVNTALAGGQPVILATLVASPGQNGLGDKLLIQGSQISGSLGEASWEKAATQVGHSLQDAGGVDLTELSDGAQVFLESFQSPATILVVGAGHIGQAVCPIAKRLGFRVAVLDDRADFANPALFPEADEIIVADIAEGVRDYPVSQSTAIVIATRGHKQDVVALREAARSPARYLGMVSSRRKVVLIYLQLLEEGIPFERLLDIHAPIGLDIGARTPEEIALSIMAEIVMERSGKKGRPLKLDEGRLHRAEEKATQVASES